MYKQLSTLYLSHIKIIYFPSIFLASFAFIIYLNVHFSPLYLWCDIHKWGASCSLPVPLVTCSGTICWGSASTGSYFPRQGHVDQKCQSERTQIQNKRTETQNRGSRATQCTLNSPMFIFHMLYIPPSKSWDGRQDCFTMIQTRNKQNNYPFNTQNIK